MEHVIAHKETKTNSMIRDVLMVMGASLVLSLLGRCSFPLGFTEVPLAVQNSVAIMFGIMMGKKRGTLAVLLFLFQGLMGMPVFAMGLSGPAVLFGPRGGYLFGYAIAAFVAGWMVERSDCPKRKYQAMAAGHLIVFATGMTWLSAFIGGFKSAFMLGVLPFLPGCLFKCSFLSSLFRFSPIRKVMSGDRI